MDILLYFAGLVIGICAFFYILSAIQAAKKKVAGMPGPSKPAPAAKIEPGTISFRKRPALPPGTRICPMCGSSLTRYEGLYASRIDMKDNSRIIIMGCRYCYTEDEDSGKPRKSMTF